MEKQAQRKALYRSKLRESSQGRDKRIDSPLVKYNEYDQPVCRVCNAILKSESLWPAHQASRKHHEAIENVKATAAGLTQPNKGNVEKPTDLEKAQPSSTLPADFFDNRGTKRQRGGNNTEVPESTKQPMLSGDHLMGTDKLSHQSKDRNYAYANQGKAGVDESSSGKKESIAGHSFNKVTQAPKRLDALRPKQVKGVLPDGFFDEKERSESAELAQLPTPSEKLDSSESKQARGTLPEGFFDNKDADLRARGIQPVKIDINDAYKEFEKEIQEDLQDVDDRMEEDEIDAAEIWEESETFEQRAGRERVEMIKKQLVEVKAARITTGRKSPAFRGKESSDDSSSDEDDDEDFAVDWRAKGL